MKTSKSALSSGSPREFGLLFRGEREALGLTHQAIADLVGCRRQTIGDLEAGKNVGLFTVFKALSVIGKRIELRSSGLELDRIADLLGEEWAND